MLRRLLFSAPLVIAILAVVLSRKSSPEPVMPRHGRNNTVLFLTTDATGLSNVHLAASSALLEHHPGIEIHYASFPKLAPKVSSISAAAVAKNPLVRPIQWHEIPGPNFLGTLTAHFGDSDGMISGMGTDDYPKKIQDILYTLAPWSAQNHWDMYQALVALADEIDPELIIIDNMLVPASDFAAHSDRKFLSLVPNGLLELITADQPRGGMLWKYPAALTGNPFPIPWKLKPVNVKLTIRLIYNLITSPVLAEKRAFLVKKGIQKPIEPNFVIKGVPVLASTLKEANVPMDFYPPYLKFCGPITLSTAPAIEQDPEMVGWIKEAPTVLINLGSLFTYNEERARIMAEGIARFLDESDFQVLWKMKKLGEYGEEAFASLLKYRESGRVRIETWLKTDPAALLETGHIVLSVHHGGANTYHEAVLAGVPQMILPLWFDLFNFAATAEYLGIGIWASRDTTPRWTPETLVQGFRTALVGARSVSLRDKAQELGKVAREYDGRKTAAAEIATLATTPDEVGAQQD